MPPKAKRSLQDPPPQAVGIHDPKTDRTLISKSYHCLAVLLGPLLLLTSGLATAIGPFIADYNHTHLFNPLWRPHAKFHGAQTMSMGAFCGLLSLYHLFQSVTSGTACFGRRKTFGGLGWNQETKNAMMLLRKERQRDEVWSAACWGSVYWVTGLSAVLYPGTKAQDPEFGGGFPQLELFVGLFAAAWVGYWMQLRQLGWRGGRWVG